MKLSHNLKALMANHRTTLSVLSRAVKVPKSSLSDWLAGSPPRKLEQVKRVADHFETTVDALVFGDTGVDVGAKAKRKSSDLTEDVLGSLLGDEWVGGCFEIRLRRIKKTNT